MSKNKDLTPGACPIDCFRSNGVNQPLAGSRHGSKDVEPGGQVFILELIPLGCSAKSKPDPPVS